MVQVIGPSSARSKSQQFGEAFSKLVQSGSEYLSGEQQKKESADTISRLTGENVSGLPTELQKAFLIEATKQQQKYKNQLELMKQLGLTGDLGIGERNPFAQSSESQTSDQEKTGENSNDDQIKVGLQTLIPQETIYKMSFINPAIADKMQRYNDNLREEGRHKEKIFREEREFEQRQHEKSPEFQRQKKLTEEQAKVDIDYNKQLQAASSQHQLKMDTLRKLDKLNKQGVTGKTYEKLLERWGLVNLTSSGRREFAADVKNLITDIRSILGSQFTGFEFQTILNAYPSADFSQEANDAIIKNLMEFQEIRNKEFEIANQIKKDNKGEIPQDFQSRVNERLKDYVQSRLPDIKVNTYEIMKEENKIPPGHMLMFSPEGEPLSVPQDQVEHYESLGATVFP